jgi:two-component system response regulator GlrR
MQNNFESRILIVDDDSSLLHLLRIRIASQGFIVACHESAEQALAAIPIFKPHVVLTDLKMEGMDGMELFTHIHLHNPTLPVIIMTAHGSINDAVEATTKGVYSFISKPFKDSELLHKISKAIQLHGTDIVSNKENENWCNSIISHSEIMNKLLTKAKRVAVKNVSILIQGESGTGKELLAKAIHNVSQRSKMPFKAVNCSAIPDQLLESELFGHQKGSFTGATKDHLGLFRAADKGTLFLDEIGDMPLPFQVKLLRALQEMQIRPVGSVNDIKVNVRVISATHIDLNKAMLAGTFREDLYYRLNVVGLHLPCLSERREDIPLLAHHCLQQIAEKYGANVKGFSTEALEYLITAEWPGNVRQLYNVIEQAVALSSTPLIPVTLVQTTFREAPQMSIPSLKNARNEFEQEYLMKILKMTNGNVSQSAKLAKRNRTEFYRLLNRHHIDPSAYK